MKLKHVLASAVALLCSVATWAQVDVTASYIGDLNAYVHGGWEGSCGNNHAESAGIGWWNTQKGLSGGHSFRNLESWCPNVGSAGVMIGRTMVLPAGNYTLSFEAYGATTENAVDKTVPAAGDIKAFFSGSDTKHDVTNTVRDDATYHPVSYTFDVATDNTVYTFGVEKMNDGSRANWARVRNVVLTLNSTNVTPVANNDVSTFTYSGTQTWHTNTWSTEGQRDGTRFHVPFHELWVKRDGGTLADATIKASYNPTQTGVYKVSAWVRALNETGGAVSGAKIFVGDTEADACAGSAITNGRLGTFTAMADGVAGTPFEYGFKLESAAINWLSFKNVTITYLGSLPQAEIDALLAQVPTGKMAASVKAELDTRVAALENNKSVANYNNLASYIATANASVNDYAALATAISNAEAYNTYKPVFSASEPAYQAAIAAAQGVYDEGTVTDCSAAITALTAAIQAANVNDYNIYTNDYNYSYATLLDTDMRNWTTSDWGMMTADQHWNGQNAQSYYEQTSAEYGQNSWSHSGTETVTLPAGNYVMGIICRADARLAPTMSVTVGESDPVTTTLTHKGASGKGVTTEGVASFDTGEFANTNGRGWEYRFLAFKVPNNDTEVTITVSASASVKNAWVSLTNPLLKGDVSPNQVVLNQIANLLTTLKGYESQIHASTYNTFSTDIANGEAATLDTQNLEDIANALRADIAKASALVAHSTAIVNNKGDITSLINGTFESNTDGWTGGSHVTNLGRSWRGTGNNKFYERKDNGALSYTLANMPAGTYKVVAAARTYNDVTGDGTHTPTFGTITAEIAGTTGTSIEGVGDRPEDGRSEINTNGVEMPYSSLGGFTSGPTGHNWRWITATGTLADDGDLVINFNCVGTYWMAIDDVHLYCTKLDGTSYTRTVGDGKGTINTSNSVVTADIIMDNPNTILRSTGIVTTAAGQNLNNNQYLSNRITKLVLYDGYDFTYSGDAYGLDNGATLYRNIPANTWCTLVVPFYPSNLDTKLVPSELSAEGVLSFTDAQTNNMNDAPMLVKSNDGVTAITGSRNGTTGIAKGNMTSGKGATMNGTYSAIINDVPMGSYVVARKDGVDALYKVNSDVSLAPFRAYFTVDAGAGVKANIITLNLDGTETAIECIDNVQTTKGNDVIYNLAGQRLSKMQKGVNIVNGKKIFVK